MSDEETTQRALPFASDLQLQAMADQTLELSIPTQSFADSYADDGKPFTPPNHRQWEKQLFRQGLKTTLIMPQRKQPKAATAVPLVIHSLTVRRNVSSMDILYRTD